MTGYMTKGDRARAYLKANPHASAKEFAADTGLAVSWFYHLTAQTRKRKWNRTHNNANARDKLYIAKRELLMSDEAHASARAARKAVVDALTPEQVRVLAEVTKKLSTPMRQAIAEWVSLYPRGLYNDALAFFGDTFSKSNYHTTRKAVLDAMQISTVQTRPLHKKQVESLANTTEFDATILAAAESLAPTEREEKPEDDGVRYAPGPVLEKLMTDAGLSFPSQSKHQQVGGDHYIKHTIQPWDAIEQWVQSSGIEAYLHGNIIKYVARYPDKDGVQDLKKAVHYIERLIEHLEKQA